MSYLDIILLGYFVNITLALLVFILMIMYFIIHKEVREQLDYISINIKKNRIYLQKRKAYKLNQLNFILFLPFIYPIFLLYIMMKHKTILDIAQKEDNRLKKLIQEYRSKK